MPTAEVVTLTALDWLVIGIYALGVIGIGYFYARKTQGTEDYLLGGRQMRPWMLGLSLFASLLSTISYLAWPGEMIRYGPLWFAFVLSYPFVFYVVGWLLIPVFMRQPVTSAYEILETRLGLSVRLLGSAMFLGLRLLWMAVIVYATSDKVLVPLIGLDPSYTSWVCAALCLLTVVYTSLGGLRAVVLTDVIQSFVLLGAAIVSLVIITNELGGVQAWWPDQYLAEWSPPHLGFHATERSLLGAVLVTFTWWVCTCGSDQIAVQRYLATRDAKAARQVLGLTLLADILVPVLLALLGLALLAWMHHHPEVVKVEPNGDYDADAIFPKFIAIGLPSGASGLVIAGLLAAAMSSLSSGMNAASSVIMTDFVAQMPNRPVTPSRQLLTARLISVGVGLLVVVLAAGVGQVSGNLLEIAQKVVNLLTSPLFVLFFLAVFVPRATPLAAWCGALASIAVAIGIAFDPSEEPWLGFLWIMPCALAAGIVVGTLVSFVNGRGKTADRRL